jgi:nicotinate phosphoribosyltransferase
MKETVLLTDQYELTMAAAYFRHDMFADATFSLFIRKYPQDRTYFVSAGLEDVIAYLESFRFNDEDMDHLESMGLFDRDFLDYLPGLKFSGSVYGIPEGRVFFRDEPILEVTAPIIEAQLAETLIINLVNLQVSVATKAARCVHAARGRGLVDFSLRRTQGMDAGVKVARSSYLAGFKGTSNVLAGKLHGIPVSGTMAHSFVTSFEEETDAFRAFAETFPENTVLLIDTYDTVIGARKAVEVAKEMAERGEKLRGVRLDSGDMAQLSKEVRKIFRDAGIGDVSIVASGGFDEFKIDRLLEEGGDIDAFGVGTKMGTSADAPYTDMAYKLVQYDGRPVLKLSSGKKTLVGEKQVFRFYDKGKIHRDLIALRDESLDGEPLLKQVMRKGKRVQDPEPLKTIRERFEKEFEKLDEKHKTLRGPEEAAVDLAPELRELQKQVIHEVKEKELGES